MAQPLYKDVCEAIIGRISRGELRPGSMLPSETELGKEMGVSKGTARKALMELEQRGLVQRRQGRGTFVRIHTPEYSLFHFFRARNLDGTRAIPSLISETVCERAPTDDERRTLSGYPGTVVQIERVRSLSGTKVLYEVSVLPKPLFPDIANHSPLTNQLYEFFQEQYGCVIIRADEQIESAPIGPKIGALLDVDENDWGLRITRRSTDLRELIVEMRTTVLSTAAHRYSISLS